MNNKMLGIICICLVVTMITSVADIYAANRWFDVTVKGLNNNAGTGRVHKETTATQSVQNINIQYQREMDAKFIRIDPSGNEVTASFYGAFRNGGFTLTAAPGAPSRIANRDYYLRISSKLHYTNSTRCTGNHIAN